MIFSAYAPLGITWLIVAADDSQAARTALQGAIEMAGLGPFALFWVGISTFLMSAKAGGVLTTTNWQLWMWAPIYFIVNVLLIVMHYHLSAPMQAWIKAAPLPNNPIDDAKPWAQPEDYQEIQEVVEAPVTDEVDAMNNDVGGENREAVEGTDGWNGENDLQGGETGGFE